MRGPIKKDRVFLAQDVQFRYVATPVRSLPGEPEINLRSFDSFTRVDGVLSTRHAVTGGLILFPRELRRATMNTFRPISVTPDMSQGGLATGLVDRLALSSGAVIESTLSYRSFEIDLTATNQEPMVYAPQTQSGGYFNDQERTVSSLQWVEALTLSRDLWRGQHVFKIGTDLQLSNYDGTSLNRPIEVRRLDGSLAERTDFGGMSQQKVEGSEFATFAQDRWRLNSRVTFEFGLRLDRDAVVERVNWSPRAGMAVSVLPEGRGIVRGGYGKFLQRTPLNVDAFPSFEARTITRFGVDEAPLGTGDAGQPHRRLVADTRGARRQRRVGSAVQPPLPAEGGVSHPPGQPRVRPQSDPRSGGAAPVEQRTVAVQGARNHRRATSVAIGET